MRLRLALTAAVVLASSLSAAGVEPVARAVAPDLDGPPQRQPVPSPWSDAWLLAHTDVGDLARLEQVRETSRP